ncbi:MAG TPA: phage tail protein, partial [Pirellulaceae bacterium]|nr:phage tail protein [Pirellulaceae bacterium]
TLQLNLGENAREALFGTVATGGQLVDAADKTRYSGYDNGAEILVIKLADHEIDSLVGFYVNDEYVPWTGSGTYHAFDNSFVEGLRVYLQTGTQTQTVPSYVTTEWSSFWPTTKTMKGCAHVFVEYADTKDRDIWPAGRPRFVWVVKGAKLYDPRKDSTVSGGSGSHRWGTPSTYEWSDNAYLCRYNWVRGIFNGTHLMVGRGLTAIEAPPERAIARANTCDETVSLKAGGTEKRYRANGLVKSTDTAIDVEEWFAAAMAGDLVDRDGVVDIDPGESRTPVWTITDGDMLDGETRVYNRHLGENQRVNTVVARYVEPTQRYEAVAAPMRRDAADVTADGRPYETTLDLQFVQSGTQAQRIAEIKRRQGRLERSFQCTVGPRYIGAESGDWVTLTSDRWLGGDSIVCVITAVQIGVDFKVTLGLREIASSVYSWTAASDELTPGTVVASSTSAPAAISVTSFAAAAAVLTTAAGSVPAIQCTWAAFTDASVTGVLLQVRKSGETTITPTTMSDATVLEAFVTAGVGAQQAMQVRAKAISNVPGRKSNWTSWTNVTTGGSTIDNALVGVGGNACVNSEFENGLTGWKGGSNGNGGASPVRSRVAGGINYVQAVVTGTPANGTVFDIYETDRTLAAEWGGAPDFATIRRFWMPVTAGQR